MHKFNIGDLLYVKQHSLLYYIDTRHGLLDRLNGIGDGYSDDPVYNEYRMRLMNTPAISWALQKMYVTSAVIDSMIKRKIWIWYPAIKDSIDQ